MVYPMITDRLLARLGACRGARRTFRRLWPNGTRANAKAVRRATNAHINLVWFGMRYLTGDAHKRFMRDANRAELMWRRHRDAGFTRSRRRAERNWWKRIAKALLLGLRRQWCGISLGSIEAP